ncbi:hypothetical protein GCM10010245_62890 [Streptomyces spectabilis]|nr:hypothetical protein GCM10010245_62890 [Streptomyces spectabilis]
MTAKTKPAIATGRFVSVYPNSRKVPAETGARQKPGRRAGSAAVAGTA